MLPQSSITVSHCIALLSSTQTNAIILHTEFLKCVCVCVFCLHMRVHAQLVLDSQKRVFSWGFGGYGRLGHTEQKDEMVPRLVKLFDFPGRGASQICTGYQCSFAVSEMGKK